MQFLYLQIRNYIVGFGFHYLQLLTSYHCCQFRKKVSSIFYLHNLANYDFTNFGNTMILQNLSILVSYILCQIWQFKFQYWKSHNFTKLPTILQLNFVLIIPQFYNSCFYSSFSSASRVDDWTISSTSPCARWANLKRFPYLLKKFIEIYELYFS